MQKGFTFIELIVVVAIFSTLIVSATVSWRYFQRFTTLESEAEKIISVLRLAQNKATASEADQNYGVYFDITDKKYILFGGDSYVDGSPDNIIYTLAPQIEFNEINLDNGPFAIFNHINGATNQSGIISIKLDDNTANFRTISVNSSGESYLTDTAILSLPPNRDSRHTHIDYDINTKNAILMRLSFPDDNFNYDINFQNYLNTAKDAFYWQGEVIVNEQKQIIEIKTHSLTDASTQFSIRRDQRYNNKAAQIFIDSDNLINYQSNGSTTKGTSLFVSEPEWQ